MSIAHWAIVAIVVFIFFGKGKIQALMADLGAGFREGKKALSELDGAHDEVREATRDVARLTHDIRKGVDVT